MIENQNEVRAITPEEEVEMADRSYWVTHTEESNLSVPDEPKFSIFIKSQVTKSIFDKN